MTMLVDSAASTTEPDWCSEHYEPSPEETFHQQDLPGIWGDGDEQVRLGLVRYDVGGTPGQCRVDVQYFADGCTLDGSAALSPAQARAFALAILEAADAAERPTR
ncbi:MAG TPA: hypothetical protein VI172_14025 [Candidatus Dormibacteraeota bacterium]